MRNCLTFDIDKDCKFLILRSRAVWRCSEILISTFAGKNTLIPIQRGLSTQALKTTQNETNNYSVVYLSSNPPRKPFQLFPATITHQAFFWKSPVTRIVTTIVLSSYKERFEHHYIILTSLFIVTIISVPIFYWNHFIISTIPGRSIDTTQTAVDVDRNFLQQHTSGPCQATKPSESFLRSYDRRF